MRVLSRCERRFQAAGDVTNTDVIISAAQSIKFKSNLDLTTCDYQIANIQLPGRGLSGSLSLKNAACLGWSL